MITNLCMEFEPTGRRLLSNFSDFWFSTNSSCHFLKICFLKIHHVRKLSRYAFPYFSPHIQPKPWHCSISKHRKTPEMDRNRQNSWGTWDPKNDTMVNFRNFLFSSYIAESELQKSATQKCRQIQAKGKNKKPCFF